MLYLFFAIFHGEDFFGPETSPPFFLIKKKEKIKHELPKLPTNFSDSGKKITPKTNKLFSTLVPRARIFQRVDSSFSSNGGLDDVKTTLNGLAKLRFNAV